MATQCPKCNADNPDTKQFCGDCGTQLPTIKDIGVTKTIETPVREFTRGSIFADRYEIIEELGKGGMGTVYRVEDKKANEEIALKLIRPEVAADKKTIDRFRNELTTARKIRHKNVCGMYDLGENEGTHYITMEYVPGEDLKSLVRRVTFDSGTAIKIAKQVCEGLVEAHRLGVVHRDLKPSNIMIDKDGNARIMDFGIARSLSAEGLTGEGIIIGTPEYMSPEQAEGKDIDQKSDIYSLGVILYEMVTRKLPFEGDTPLSVAMKHKGEIPKAPKEYNSQIPDELNLLILNCLEKDKGQRLESADRVLSGLEEIEKSIVTTEKTRDPWKRPSTIRQITDRRKKPILISVFAIFIVVVVLAWIFLFSPSKILPPPQLINPVTITTSLGIEAYPSFSPEAGRLAFESDQSGNWDIWISDINSGVSVNLTEDNAGHDRSPSWSPDGSQIAFLSTRDGVGCFVMSHLGGNVHKMASIANSRLLGLSISPPQWSRDNTQLALFDSDPSGLNFFLKIVNLKDGSTKNLALPGPNKTGIDHAWSPDGRFITYVDTLHPDTDVSQIWMIRISDGEGFPLTNSDYIYKNPSWSSDGKHVYFMSNRGGANDLWRQEVDLNGHPLGEPQSISTGLELKHFCFSLDGSKLAYATGREITNVWRIPILENRLATWEDAEQLTSEQIYVGQVEVSSDGKKLLLDRRLRGLRALWMMDLESGDMQQITSGLPREHVVGRLSQDGTKVVYHMPGLNDTNVWAFSIKDRQTWQVTDEKGWNGNPCWSPDGKRIAFVSSRSGNFDIWIVNEKGDTARQLTKNPANDAVPRWSPDGEWILFYSTRMGSGQIWKVPAKGGHPEPVTNQGTSFGTTWSLDGKHVYFVRESNIWQVSVDGKNEKLMADLKGKSGNLQFPLSTDGKYIYFDLRAGSGDIWVMDLITKEK